METINLNQITRLEASLDGVSGVARQAEKNLGCLDDRLLTLRLNFGKLRAALERAFAPITATVTPILNSAIRALTDFCDDAGSVIAALFGTVYKKAVTTTRSTGSAIRKTLASFDEIQRLSGGSGGGSTEKTVTYQPINDPLTPQLQAIVTKIQSIMAYIRSLLAPLQAIDLTPAASGFAFLGQAIANFAAVIGENLEWAWHNLLVPLAQWTIEAAIPASVDALTAAFSALTAILEPVLSGIRQLQPALAPVAGFLSETVLLAVRNLSSGFSALSRLFSEKAPAISAIFTNIGSVLSALWAKAQPVLSSLRSFFSQVLEAMTTAAGSAVSRLLELFGSLTEFLSGVFSGNWAQAWEGLKGILKGAVNGVIGLINGLLSGLAKGLNNVAATLNRWKVTVPDWVPGIGGKHFGFKLGTVTAPQIPYLAQGAVLPANKPFLAVVGDQRHGTNVEAPLSTIQEAVAAVMQDQTAAIAAGFDASVEVQRQILQAVLGIRIGDEVIASAYDRCRTKLAVMKGV